VTGSESQSTVKVSVVIPTYNRRSSLERCLSSLAAQSFPVMEYEVIVVADGCTDDTVELLRSFAPRFAFRWLSQQNQGAPAAQNLGVAAATGAIILFLDDDCVCGTDVIAAHYDAHAQQDQIVAIGALRLHPDTPPGTLHDVVSDLEDTEWRRLTSEGARRSDLMLCANSSVSRMAALDCRFDTTYMRMHDVEAGIRLWAKGFRPRFVPRAIVYELYTKTVSAMLADSYQHGKYEVLLSNNYPSFKPLTGIVNINQGNYLKRAMRRQLAERAVFSEFALASAAALVDCLRSVPFLERLAKRILRARAGTAHLRGAMKEAGSWKILEERFGKRVPVIMFHNVGTPRLGEYPGLTTSIAEFETQISFLAKMGYKSIQPSEWLRWRDDGGTLPKRPVMLVFDDAYADACRNAFPLLERRGFSAACMVVTAYIGSTNRWDEEAGLPSFPLMSESEIRSWSSKGIEFGGHSRHHLELQFVKDEPLEREIVECKADLTALLGKPPTSFAYPFGGVSSRVEAVVRNHFDIAFTAWQGVLHLGTNPHLVPRIRFLPGETRFGIWCRLRLGRNLFEICRGRWARLVGKTGDDAAARRVLPV
jgi:glycosyltransferase involved in cell wall biosynthesis/peptidoglycan/xylan/chitin deacetylase (PgdA/CDA1 family)